jgi:hypothetical protein
MLDEQSVLRTFRVEEAIHLAPIGSGRFSSGIRSDVTYVTERRGSVRELRDVQCRSLAFAFPTVQGRGLSMLWPPMMLSTSRIG